jgi:ABC-type bacteriocin/lantibiotic exporter with double-glycine peptidase domain
MSLLSEKFFSFSKEEKEKKSIMQGITSDNFINAKTIKYLNVKRFAINRLKASQDDAWVTSVNPGKIWYFRLVDIIGILPLILNIYICRNNPEMIALIVISNWTLENMRNNVIGVAEYVIEINSNEDIIKNLKGDDTSECNLPLTKDIVLDNVFFDYGEDTTKFHISHLEFKRGTKTLVVGQSGAGKSSLANLLAGSIKPTTGHVPELNVFYVWQETESLDDSLWNNIVFHNPYNIKEEEILEYFEKLDMLDWFQKELKDGFNTMIGERGCRISSGQKQRLNIIRTIIELRNNPGKVFILDEITSNLDDHTKTLAIKLFKEYMMPETTAIFISHNDGFDQLCDRKITVENHEFIFGEI